MKCPHCKSKLTRVPVKVQGAKSKVISYQCDRCGYFTFEKKSGDKVIAELKEREVSLKLHQRVVKLSHNRLGLYINKNVARSLNLKGGEDVYVSIPGKKKMLIEVA